MPVTGLSKQRQGQLGVNAVERIVLQEWKSRWQPLDAVNDDGVDGLIFIERGGVPTGQIIHVQVKCRSEQPKDGIFALPIGTEKLAKNAARWRRVVGAAILVKVDPESLAAYWTDVRDGGSVVGSQVFVPAANKFDASAKNRIADLCGTLHGDLLLRQIKTTADDFKYLTSKSAPVAAARQEYVRLNTLSLHFAGSNAAVHFTREGWRHMNRRGRERLAKSQSWTLVGTLAHIVQNVSENSLLVVRPSRRGLPELVAATVTVLFPHRQSAIVRAVFRRRGQPGSWNYSLHTLYEPRRKRNLMGV
ncbi:DUF4365 domain-containing protein [Phenylobacterium sp.]|uniref:DUF4365 domain-containing protein n=1 Tax=Phenylobacterium sp. TaxID=1871053 RepID=UPI002897F034|nr:DUF4365 domain-containing protein [Phenylobacterium sp.]